MNVTIKMTHGQSPIAAQGTYIEAYGTAGYLNQMVDDRTAHCKTHDGQHRWAEVDTDDVVMVYVISGDAAQIAPLVKAEIEHFDCEATVEFDATTHQERAARFMAQHGGEICEEHSSDQMTRVLLGDCCHDFLESGNVATYDFRFDEFSTESYDEFLAEWNTVARG